MRVLITGSSGFIGSHLLIAACNTFGSKNVISFSSRPNHVCPYIVYEGDNFNLSPANLAMVAEVDVLIHAGAFTPKNGSQSNLIDECNGNIRFTEKLLALPFKSLKKIIYTSTLDVYESAEITTETTLTLPSSLYGWSKLYCERMIAIFAANHHQICQILRVGHVYGPGEEKYSKFLPKAIKNILADEPVELWGDGSEIRSLIYIDDVIAAILQALEFDEDLGPVNVVGGTAVTIRELLEQLIVVSGKLATISEKEYSGIKRNCIFDNSKLRKYLLNVETDLTTGLQNEYNYMAGLG